MRKMLLFCGGRSLATLSPRNVEGRHLPDERGDLAKEISRLFLVAYSKIKEERVS